MKKVSLLRLVMSPVVTSILAIGATSVAENPVITYHQNGILEFYYAGGVSTNACLVQPNGAILTVGLDRLSSSSQADNFFSARFLANPSASFDSSFNGNGVVTTAVGTNSSSAKAAALLSDGRIVEAGFYVYPITSKTSGIGFSAVRYQANGTLDTTFGSGGVSTTVITGTTNGQVEALALNSDNSTVIAGYSLQTVNRTSQNSITLIHLLSNGSLDTAFGRNGMVITNAGSSSSVAYGVAVSGSNIIVAGKAKNSSGNNNFALAEYNAAGTLVPGFGTQGIVLDQVGVSSGQANAVTVDASGRILVAGWSYDSSGNQDFTLVRYLANGARDTSFGSNGAVQTYLTGGDSITSIALQANVALPTNSAIVVAGTTDSNATPIGVVRYTSSGTLDLTFNATGTLLTTVPNNPLTATAALQSNQEIIITGSTDEVPSNSYLIRLNTNGSVDTTF